MPSLSVRRLDQDVYERLRDRARAHGISMEEEVRRVLAEAVLPPPNLGQLALELFGEEHGVELELLPREVSDPPDFGEP